MNRASILPVSFFDRPTLVVARELIGKYLVRRIGDEEMALQLNEVEAYDGFEDRASHAHRGQTPRNAVMFGPAGSWYVYLVYGMHWMLNIVTGSPDYPAAILLRGAGTIIGPGRLTKFLSVDRSLNGKQAIPQDALWIEDRGHPLSSSSIITTPRIGVDYAGPEWAGKPYRFILR